tara:strand:- start:646 stop:1179 length:534 start_codon:yes stop_codon:yes gene_type:complete
MKQALHKKDRIRIRKPKRQEKAIIMVDNGICSLEADVGVMGIQLEFRGKAEITPDLPEGWILQGNRSRMIMFTLQALPIQNQTLFTYTGSIDILKAIVSNDKGEQLSEAIKTSNSNWDSQSFNFMVDTTSWEDYKDTKRVGKVKKTIYNLPDYDLPKVEKKTKIKRTQASSRSTGGY